MRLIAVERVEQLANALWQLAHDVWKVVRLLHHDYDTPLDFSTLYTRRPELLRSVFALTPEYLQGDVREPRTILEEAARILDFDRPVGLRLTDSRSRAPAPRCPAPTRR